jgi:hypothetical protein
VTQEQAHERKGWHEDRMVSRDRLNNFALRIMAGGPGTQPCGQIGASFL